MDLQSARRLQSELMVCQEAGEAASAALIRMKPGDKLIIERHEFERGKSLFTFTERTFAVDVPG